MLPRSHPNLSHKQVLSIFLSIITTIVNLFLTTGTFPINYKQSLVTLLLKTLQESKNHSVTISKFLISPYYLKSLSVSRNLDFTITSLLIFSKILINLLILDINQPKLLYYLSTITSSQQLVISESLVSAS